MKNYILLAALLFVTNFCRAQTFVLIDQTMSGPVLYTDDVSVKNTYKNIFVVETKHLQEFVVALNKIYSRLTAEDNKNNNLNFIIGNTKISSIPINIRNEERFDIIMSTHTRDADVSMHLSNPKNSNEQNLFFISSWIKYINAYRK